MSPEKRKIIISVVSDLVTDQRVNRAATALHEAGFLVTLVGRRKKSSLALSKRPYSTKRFYLLFEKGPFFYLHYNFCLFIYLLFNRADVYLSNDLDTLLANFLSSKIKGVKLVYDSHEYFTEVPELVSRPNVQAIWLKLEKWIFPKLKKVMTVNDSIASFYRKKYNVPVHVVRNLPVKSTQTFPKESRKNWNLPEDKKVFLFQGAGINIDRGGEEAIRAIQRVDGAVLLFIGGGDVLSNLKNLVSSAHAEEKVFFIPQQPFNELLRFTSMADFGLTLDKDTNLNYKYSLPNKLFDYMQAGLPVLATDLPEVKRIVDQYDVGLITPSLETDVLAAKMREMMHDEEQLARWKKNLNIAASELCWENEKRKFLELFTDVG